MRQNVWRTVISAGTNPSRNSVFQGFDTDYHTVMLEASTWLLSPILHKSGLGHEIRTKHRADRKQDQQVKGFAFDKCVVVSIW